MVNDIVRGRMRVVTVGTRKARFDVTSIEADRKRHIM